MTTVAIPNLDVKVWTHKSGFPQENLLLSLTQPKITRQIKFELTNIDYNIIKDEISRIERVEYNTAVVSNFMNVYDIEDFELFSGHNMKYFQKNVNKP